MNDFKEMVTGAEDRVHDAIRAASRGGAAERRCARSTLYGAMCGLGAARKSVAISARDAADAADGYVRRNPWESLSLAAVAGFAMGFLLRPR